MKLTKLTAAQRKCICDHYVMHKCINCPYGIVINDDYETIIDSVNDKIRRGHIECAEWLFDLELEDEQISLLKENNLLPSIK